MDKYGITWNENEITLCLGLYYLRSSGVVPYSKGIKALAQIFNRTESSIDCKLGNLSIVTFQVKVFQMETDWMA